jgi:hypothetical protein
MWMGALQKHTGKGVPAPQGINLRDVWPIRSLFPSPPRSKTQRRKAMAHPTHHHKINYIEFHSTDIAQTKKFYSAVFGWTFQDYGPDYISFDANSADIAGGFAKGEPGKGLGELAPLIVLYSADLKATQNAIEAAGGRIVVPTFEFPGGRRFHFADGAGNVLAVWSE